MKNLKSSTKNRDQDQERNLSNTYTPNFAERTFENIANWLVDIKEHELTSIVELVEKAKQYLLAAEALPEQKVSQFAENLRFDLKEFYQLNQKQASESVYLGLMNETFWRALAKVTDQSQVEWAELCEDFDHDGIYHKGDYIGFGDLECLNCHHRIAVAHFTEIGECFQCNNGKFKRHSYHSQ